MTGPVVVGIDGSPAGTTAAWWAAREAASRRRPLLLLHSWSTQPLDVPLAHEALGKQQNGGRLLQRTETELLHHYPGLVLTTELTSTPATEALLDLGGLAELLVLGSRGHGSTASFLLGSTSLYVLGRARCPAVVVRAGDPAVEDGSGRPVAADRGEVVVGVKETGRAADPLLEFAFAAADRRRARVRVVRALQSFGTVAPVHAMAAGHADSHHEAEEHARLAAVLAPWREKFPHVRVVEQVAAGPAAAVLLYAAERSELTVLGRRRNPSHLTWRLGPVAHAALHHMPCPVAVVPHD
ncbi:universal stress protein [Streptomyces panaciradicis]|uniref:universal stress protein n=1 Tax=Streptomyces panaciradicis TaxID=1470261 RepID=UPI00201CB981|nr:universal stress protein [Streptomyces panaciradicis]MCL6668080.1 universal stress protein [Streptomyces panaciradicis]